MVEYVYNLRKNTSYSLIFSVPTGSTPSFDVDNAGVYSVYAGATGSLSGTTFTVNINPAATTFPEQLVVRNTTGGAILVDLKVNWEKGPAQGTPADGTVTLPKLAFDPATQVELDFARSQIATAALLQHRTLVAAGALDANDDGNVLELNAAAQAAITVPANATVNLPVGFSVTLRVYGAGPIAVTAGAGVTIRSAGGALRVVTQYAEATLVKRATDEWVLAGTIAV